MMMMMMMIKTLHASAKWITGLLHIGRYEVQTSALKQTMFTEVLHGFLQAHQINSGIISQITS
jgi:hypothetical protein